MTPKAWSFSALDAYENCPRQYYEVKVARRYQEETSQQMQWGRDVHAAFERRLLYDTPLPLDLQVHEDFLAWFKAQPGEIAGEERIALDTTISPCGYFDKQRTVWMRGQVDARKRDLAAGKSFILDHKTGKVKNDFRQLKLFAIHEFRSQPQIHEVRVEYYWTQTKAASGEVYRREQLWDLVREFVPALNRFAGSFRTGTWTPKQSGLCNGWCPVTTCEFWRPKRRRG